jgi:hypothetical protein
MREAEKCSTAARFWFFVMKVTYGFLSSLLGAALRIAGGHCIGLDVFAGRLPHTPDMKVSQPTVGGAHINSRVRTPI